MLVCADEAADVVVVIVEDGVVITAPSAVEEKVDVVVDFVTLPEHEPGLSEKTLSLSGPPHASEELPLHGVELQAVSHDGGWVPTPWIVLLQ